MGSGSSQTSLLIAHSVQLSASTGSERRWPT